jgi:HlyD family secretion protein
MNRKVLFLILGSGVSLAALLAWAFAPRPVEVEVAEATVGHFETTIDEDARTRLRDRFVVSAPMSGRLQRISLREGDAVKAGATIATLLPVMSPMVDERTLEAQRARIGVTDAEVERAATRIEAAKVVLEQARIEQRRTEQLAQQGFVAPTKIDADRLAVQSAQRELDTAVQGEHVARHGLEEARAALSVLREGAGRGGFALRAPIDGRVLKVHDRSEATVALGAPLLEIGDTSKMEIVAELLTTDALLAQPGSAVRIERWGGPTALQGRVRLIEPAAFTKVSALGVEEQRVNVLIDILSPFTQWAALGDGYRVGVRIVTGNEDGALRVPVSAIFPLSKAAATANAAVFIYDAGHARLQAVTVAARNDREAWIKAGLTAGAKVVVYPPSTIVDGAAIRERKV